MNDFDILFVVGIEKVLVAFFCSGIIRSRGRDVCQNVFQAGQKIFILRPLLIDKQYFGSQAVE